VDSFKTIRNKSEGLYKEKGSKFLAFAYPVKTEEDCKAHLEELKKEHFSARHHCYAYRLGAEGTVWRANDAGEPNNTAGKPILGQIQSKELTNVLVVVVRYFGGTLLGAGGLIQAYKSAAADALEKAEIIAEEIVFKGTIRFGFDQMNDVMRILKTCHCKILEQHFNSTIAIDFEIPKRETEKLESFVKKIPHQVQYDLHTVD
jgi:uncharacterized YigZ family protein